MKVNKIIYWVSTELFCAFLLLNGISYLTDPQFVDIYKHLGFPQYFRICKTFNAPIALVWNLWTDPELVKQWWGPEHFTSSVAKIDFKEGGTSIVNMIAPKAMGGQAYFSGWFYVKIVPLKMIEFIQRLSDESGNEIVPQAVGMPADFPAEIKTVVNFEAIDKSNTAMTVTEYAEFGSISQFAQLGLEQSVKKMKDVLKVEGGKLKVES